jgi:Na+-translocating ferredoxin:NAD+ oxidoreductase RNF subunit RnfB
MDLWRELQRQLDQYSVGFPETASGVEIKILQKLFTPDQAEAYLQLSLLLQSPAQVAPRLGRTEDETAALLETMADKGLAFRLRRDDGARYGAAAFVVGIFEYQLPDMDREFVELLEQYFHEAFGRQIAAHKAPMRPIPVGRSVDTRWPVAPYEDARHIFKDKNLIAVAECVCRRSQSLIDQACDKPLEVCFMFGAHAQYYIERGMGRPISYDEAMAIIDKCDEAGLVPQPFASQDSGGMCNCCGDCCGVLRGIKKHPRPADMVFASHVARVDEDECTACETCLDRCQMEAITIEDVAMVDEARCIGCGLCVTTCPTGAMLLELRPEDRREAPPAKAQELMMRWSQERGTSLVPLRFTRS